MYMYIVYIMQFEQLSRHIHQRIVINVKIE